MALSEYMQKQDDYCRTTKLLERMPSIWDHYRTKRFPKPLKGATIVAIGTFDSSEVEGGGLVIHYQPKGSRKTRRAVFGFNELGMWLEGNYARAPE